MVVVVGILAAVSFAFLVRRRRSMNGRPSSQGSDSNPNFVFSSVYEVLVCPAPPSRPSCLPDRCYVWLLKLTGMLVCRSLAIQEEMPI